MSRSRQIIYTKILQKEDFYYGIMQYERIKRKGYDTGR